VYTAVALQPSNSQLEVHIEPTLKTSYDYRNYIVITFLDAPLFKLRIILLDMTITVTVVALWNLRGGRLILLRSII
jgi:hypothetical protein